MCQQCDSDFPGQVRRFACSCVSQMMACSRLDEQAEGKVTATGNSELSSGEALGALALEGP